MPDRPCPQAPVDPSVDLRDMVRRHVVRRSLACMDAAARRRRQALADGSIDACVRTLRTAVRRFYGALPAGPDHPAPAARTVSVHEKDGYRIENVLFESFPGWEVNASVYIPADGDGPWPGIVVPVGHSNKLGASYQLPCQYFALSGCVAVTFDPPGQSGEKREGNDHFRDGVRCYPVGESSSQYFVADALRCVDYLHARPDVDTARGVAMTGVSGGGTTTTFAVHLDDRIAVIGPSCCLAQLADLDITQAYAGCPETHPWRRYAEGVDEVDLCCAAAPRPCLLMAGAADEVFQIDDTRRLANLVQAFYTAAGAGDRFAFFEDAGGHAYTLAQAQAFVRFPRPVLDPDTARPEIDTADPRIAMNPDADLRCHPQDTATMRTRAAAAAARLRQARDGSPTAVRRAAHALLQLPDGGRPAPAARAAAPFLVWTHHWQELLLDLDADLQLPATLLASDRPGPLLLHADAEHRHRLFYRGGLLPRLVRHLDRARARGAALAVDLPGTGDAACTMYPYEIAPWGDTDRYLTQATAALGDPLLAIRARAVLATLAYARSRSDLRDRPVVLTGCGAAAIAVLLAAAAAAEPVAGLALWDFPASIATLVGDPDFAWPEHLFMPGLLEHADIADLVRGAGAPTRLFGPQNAVRQPLAPAETASFLNACGQHATACDQLDGEGEQNLLAWLDILEQKAEGRS